MNEPNYEKFWKEAKEELAYWKQKYEAMRQRCEAVERLIRIIPVSSEYQDTPFYKKYFSEWQSFLNKEQEVPGDHKMPRVIEGL